jgi:catechol 2,3-dioxygenase-like lactoylglutathione lyase family enzyme
MLGSAPGFSSFSVDDVQAARRFYGETLGLTVADKRLGGAGVPDGLELTIGGATRVLIYPKADHAPASFTVVNFTVTDIERAVDDLAASWSAVRTVPVRTQDRRERDPPHARGTGGRVVQRPSRKHPLHHRTVATAVWRLLDPSPVRMDRRVPKHRCTVFAHSADLLLALIALFAQLKSDRGGRSWTDPCSFLERPQSPKSGHCRERDLVRRFAGRPERTDPSLPRFRISAGRCNPTCARPLYEMGSR